MIMFLWSLLAIKLTHHCISATRFIHCPFMDEKAIETLCAAASVAMKELDRMRANPDCQAVFGLLTPTKSGLKGGFYEEQDG